MIINRLQLISKISYLFVITFYYSFAFFILLILTCWLVSYHDNIFGFLSVIFNSNLTGLSDIKHGIK